MTPDPAAADVADAPKENGLIDPDAVVPDEDPAAPTPVPRGETADTDARARQADDDPGCVQRPGHDGPSPATLSGPAEPGRYTYEVAGTWTAEGPQGKRDGELPPRGTRTRTPPRDRSGDGYRFQETRRGAEDGSAEVTLRVSSDRLVLERWESRGENSWSFEPTPPVVMLRFPLARDASWESTGTDGETTMTVRARVLRDEEVEVCGSTYPAWVVEATSTIVSGGARIETKGLSWTAPSLGGLVLRDEGETVTSGRSPRGAFEIRTRGTRQLRSVTPE